MRSDFRELVKKFELVEQRLEALLASSIDPSDKVLLELDKQLTTASDELFQVQLFGSNDHISRIRFFVERIRKAPLC